MIYLGGGGWTLPLTPPNYGYMPQMDRCKVCGGLPNHLLTFFWLYTEEVRKKGVVR